jgi:hypothetical protein
MKKVAFSLVVLSGMVLLQGCAEQGINVGGKDGSVNVSKDGIEATGQAGSVTAGNNGVGASGQAGSVSTNADGSLNVNEGTDNTVKINPDGTVNAKTKDETVQVSPTGGVSGTTKDASIKTDANGTMNIKTSTTPNVTVKGGKVSY